MQINYKLIGINSVKRLVDGACIPFADGNRDYEEYKQWISEGNTPEPEFTEEELMIKEINSQIQEAKVYLTDTGWIWEKYNRNVLVLKDMTSEEFSLKYSDIISKQEEYRALINELEVEIPDNKEEV